MQRKRIAIIGGGAAGLFAAACCSELIEHEVVVFEKNKFTGKKLLITGKGRCNVTNSCDINEFFKNIPVNSRFMYSSLYSFTNEDTMDFFENIGLPLKQERGKRVFPCSDKASDVRDVLLKKSIENGVKFIHKTVKNIKKDSNEFFIETDEKQYVFDSVIIATGGKSYPLTGSTGDGYEFAQKFGHSIVPPKASLVPIVCRENWCGELMGLSLKNVTLKIANKDTQKVEYEDFGEMLFTHYGISGPIVLSATSFVRNLNSAQYVAIIDLKPALTHEQLSKRVLGDFNNAKNKDFVNSLSALLPSKLIPVVVALSGIPPHKKVNEITKEERQIFVNLLKEFKLSIKGTRPISEAIITSGGVNTAEINPKTMESKIVSGLYFAGEVVDVDAYTGGFNLQIAFSMAHAAITAILNKE